MPGRKSGDGVEDGSPEQVSKKATGLSVDDLNLPRSMVQRLAKGVLPPNTQIQKDALMAISKSATVFVNYLASHAQEFALKDMKRTIRPEDVMQALEEVEFGSFQERCEAELASFINANNKKRNDYRKRVKEKENEDSSLAVPSAEGGDIIDVESHNGGSLHAEQSIHDSTTARSDGSEPATKKMRTSVNGTASSVAVDQDDDDTMSDVEDEQGYETAGEAMDDVESEGGDDEVDEPPDEMVELAGSGMEESDHETGRAGDESGNESD